MQNWKFFFVSPFLAPFFLLLLGSLMRFASLFSMFAIWVLMISAYLRFFAFFVNGNQTIHAFDVCRYRCLHVCGNKLSNKIFLTLAINTTNLRGQFFPLLISIRFENAKNCEECGQANGWGVPKRTLEALPEATYWKWSEAKIILHLLHLWYGCAQSIALMALEMWTN